MREHLQHNISQALVLAEGPLPTPCLLWQRSGSRGYGKLKVRGRLTLAHRYVWEQQNGPIPEGLFVLHRCDRPACVNVGHLELGDQRQNMADCVRRGRIANGSRNGNSRLTEADVLDICARLDAGESKVSLARAFGVSDPMIGKIDRGEKWGHLTRRGQR